MHKLLAAFLLAWCSFLRVQAQNTSSYKFSADIEKEMQSGKPGANQYAAWDYSYIGEYQTGLTAWDGPSRSARSITATDSLAFTALQPVDAHRYILNRARTERIIIINEAHHNPRHRAFTASLLPDLAKLGFQYLAVEGLDEQDSLLNNRGYPVMQTGYYTKEPQFGQLLRAAAQSKYKLIAYDYGFSREGTMEARVLARETAQAQNIQRILQANPTAKIVVHCGFSHANEGPDGMGEQMAMAGHLRQLTGINPFTIDQIALTEASMPGGESARFRLVKATSSSVFLNAQQEPYAQANPNMSVDVNVYHPRTTYQAGRPNWVFGAGRKPVPIAKTITVGFPCLVLAYATQENIAQAVPVDVVELQNPQDRKALALGKGRYMIVAKDKAGATQVWNVKK